MAMFVHLTPESRLETNYIGRMRKLPGGERGIPAVFWRMPPD